MTDSAQKTETAQLDYGDGGRLELPVLDATEGNRGYAISSLLKETGNVVFDPGFMNTANARSSITYIDGANGVLRYRGYPIEELAQHSSFIETAYLLIYGELPSPAELEDFDTRIRRHTMVHEDLKSFFNGFPRNAHPMPVLSSAVSALSTFYADSLDPFDKEQVEISTIRLLAKVPTLAAYAYKKSKGEPLPYPKNDLNYAENFLRMCFGVPAEDYEIDPTVAKALDILLMLHADHEQNCSTSTVRLVGSSHANMFGSVSAGINALYGPLHGGANEAVLTMLNRIQVDGIQPEEFMEQVKNKESGARLMGFGHRVYKNYDPRARIVMTTPTRSSRSSAATTSSWTSPCASRRRPSPTTTSWSASSTRTSTSTPASSTRPWASRRRCSRCSSPSAGCPAGSPCGAR
jgi:citrate synthase